MTNTFNTPLVTIFSQEVVGNEHSPDARAHVEAAMSEEDFFVALKQSIVDMATLDLTDQVVHISTTIKLARSESLHIKNGTIIGDCHSIFSMGTDRGYTNGPPALTLDGVRV